MKVVKILGGLGNQMFQYALALSLKHRYPTQEVKIDTLSFNHYPLHNGFEIKKIFGNNLKEATVLDLCKIAYPYFNYRVWQIGSRILPTRKTMITQHQDEKFEPIVFSDRKKYFDGYWQSEKYFSDIREQILYSFTFRQLKDDNNINLSEIIKSNTCVSIHIRRGDYLKNPIYKNICTLDYYIKSIQYIKSKVNVDYFIIFSNDIEWCRQNSKLLINDTDFKIVNWNIKENSYRDMQLMSLCQHNIVANSSFSWWGAWLNQNSDKIVVAPKRWINGDLNLDTIPNSWIKI